jgi:hypothetical protein
MEIAANKIAPAQVPIKTHSGHSSPRLQIDRVTLTSNRPAGVGDAYRAPQGTERIKPRHSAKQHRCQGNYPPPIPVIDPNPPVIPRAAPAIFLAPIAIP